MTSYRARSMLAASAVSLLLPTLLLAYSGPASAAEAKGTEGDAVVEQVESGQGAPGEVPDADYVGEIVATSVDPDGFLPDTAAAQQALPPSCVLAFPQGNFVINYVDVLNACDSFQRAKVLIAFGPDSSCFNLAPNEGERHAFGKAARFDGLVRC